MTSRQLLDRVHSLAAVAELDADVYAAQLATELAEPATLADFEARDAVLVGALRHVDDTIARVMKLRLDHALVSDSSIGPPTRKVFAATVADYATDLSRLFERAREVAERGRAADPGGVAALVVEAARSTLALREALQAGVLALVRDLSTAAVAIADRQAKDKKLPDAQRTQWSAARRDLEVLAADPTRILVAPFAARLAAWPEQLDDPPPEAEPSFADMIEMD